MPPRDRSAARLSRQRKPPGSVAVGAFMAVLLAVFGVGPASGASNTSAPTAQDHTTLALSAAFSNTHRETAWPVPHVKAANISSTFGPRVKKATDAYDFHRGIDISAPVGSPVVAAYHGTVSDVRVFPEGGLTVIVRHELPEPVEFHGQLVSEFHTYYMHLSTVLPEVQSAFDSGLPYPVESGEKIGTVGDSGAAVSSHLHFEVRLGSRCSLEYQRANPASSCASLGADPHVHPLLLFPAPPSDLTVDLAVNSRSNGEVVVSVSAPDSSPMANRFDLVVIDDGVATTTTIDLNQRIGFDASTNAALDEVDKSQMYLAPWAFGVAADRWSTRVVIPSSDTPFLGDSRIVRLTVTDIWGRAAEVTVGGISDG